MSGYVVDRHYPTPQSGRRNSIAIVPTGIGSVVRNLTPTFAALAADPDVRRFAYETGASAARSVRDLYNRARSASVRRHARDFRVRAGRDMPMYANAGVQTQGMEGINALINAGRRTRRVVMKKKTNYRKRSLKRGKGKRKYNGKGRKAAKRSNKSLGQVAVSGGSVEEDKRVKKHQKRGIVYEYGSASSLSAANGVMLTHSTMPERSLLRAVVLSLLKSMLSKFNLTFKDCQEAFPGINSITNFDILFTYKSSGAWSTISPYNFSTATAISNVAIGVEALFTGLSASVVQAFEKFGTLTLQEHTTAKIVGVIDLDNTFFKMDLASNLVYQNRSVSQESATSSTNALDVAQDPLFEVQLNGKGTGPIGVNDRDTLNFFVDYDTGVSIIDVASGTPGNMWLAEPSKGMFINVRKAVNTMSQPGVVKQSKLTSYYYFSLTKLIPYLRLFGTVNNTKLCIGKFRTLWFRKCISLPSGDKQNMTMAYHHHWAVGVTCTIKKDFRTQSYVANAS